MPRDKLVSETENETHKHLQWQRDKQIHGRTQRSTEQGGRRRLVKKNQTDRERQNGARWKNETGDGVSESKREKTSKRHSKPLETDRQRCNRRQRREIGRGSD